MIRRAQSPAPRLTVRPLRPDDWHEVETLFGNNGACGGCWCMWWRLERGGKLWEANKGEPNHRALRRLVKAGVVHAALAFAGREPVGWCSIGPRRDFPKLARSKAMDSGAPPDAWVVTCLFIRAGWRGRGVATALLRSSVDIARDQGAKLIEGFPVRPKTTGHQKEPVKIAPAFAYTGVPRMFERSGFHEADPTSTGRPVFRRRLRRSKRSSAS